MVKTNRHVDTSLYNARHVIILYTTGTTYTFYEREIAKGNYKTQKINRKQRNKSKRKLNKKSKGAICRVSPQEM